MTSEERKQELEYVTHKALEATTAEITSARRKFPGNKHMLAALVEEVGELAQAMLDCDRNNGLGVENIYDEAIQVACMAIRIATEGDYDFVYSFPGFVYSFPGPAK